MTLKTVPVIGIVYWPSGEPVAGARIRAELTRQEIDDGMVVPAAVETLTADDGTFLIALWPNARGVAGSQYRVLAARHRMPLLEVLITVPDIDGPVAIESIISQAPYPPVPVAQVAQEVAQAAALEAGQRAHEAQGHVTAAEQILEKVEEAAQDVGTWTDAAAGHAITAGAASLIAVSASADSLSSAAESGNHAGSAHSAATAANLALLGLHGILATGVGVFAIDASGDLIATYHTPPISGMSIDAGGNLIVTY